MTDPIRIPRGFYDDHKARDLPTPTPTRETKRHVWIRPDDPDTPELLDDARYYADPTGFDERRWSQMARALLAAFEKAAP